MHRGLLKIIMIGVVGALLAAWGAPPAHAQQARFDHVVHSVLVDSGSLDNRTDNEAVVFAQRVDVDQAPWLRLVFDKVRLGAGSYLRISSKLDSDVQFLDARTVLEWQNTTAYFNGSGVLVELVAGARSVGNHVRITRVLAGGVMDGPSPEARVCSGNDTRTPSSDPRACRLLSVVLPIPNCGPGFPCGNIGGGVCSASITNQAVSGEPNNRVLLSAGHCFAVDPASGFSQSCTVAQFGVPQSVQATCQLRHPLVAKQFVIDPFRSRFQSGGPGNDWAAFVCFNNPVTGRSCFQEQGQAFALGAAPAVNAPLTKFGYGAQGEASSTDPFCACTPGGALAALHCTQQTSSGVVRAIVGTLICHDVRDCAGDSGEPLVAANGALAGIGTHGTCPGYATPNIPGCPAGLPSPRNAGTAISHAGLQAAISLLVNGGGAPQNNACANATVVADSTTYFTTVGATTDGNSDTRCNSGGDSNVQRDVWFRYTALVSGSTIFSLCGSTFDTRLAIYSNNCVPAANTALACNDDNDICGGGSLQSDIVINAVANTTYLIRVGGFGGATGLGALTIIPPALRPPNDNCSNAFILPEGTWEFSTNGATTDSPDGCDIYNEVWYGFVADANGTVEVSTCIGTGYNTFLAAYTAGGAGLCPPGVQLACNDDACWIQSRITFPVVIGNVYLVAVGGFGGETGTGYITRTAVIPGGGPSNNQCAFASPAVDGDNPFTTIGATTDGPTDCGVMSDVWFRYVATATGLMEISTCSSVYDTMLSVYAGDCPALGPPLACNDDACGLDGRQSGVLFQSGAGRTYLIRVGGYAGLTGAGNLQIFPPDAGPPLNDLCAYAVPVVDGLTPFNTTGCTTDGPPGCAATRDMWFWYTAEQSGIARFSLCGSYYDTFLAVYDSIDCPPTNLRGCNDDSNTCGGVSLQSQLEISVFAGHTFSVRVGGYNNATGEGLLTITPLEPACPCDTTNDGTLNSQDFFDFLSAFFAASPVADFNNSGTVNSQDFFDFLSCFFAGC